MRSDNRPEGTESCPRRFEDLSFDEWKNLYDAKPEQFEKCRLKLINDLVESAPERTKGRLKGLIFQMEAESQRSKSLEAYNMRLAAMMMDTLGELKVQLKRLVGKDSRNTVQDQIPVKTATVLSFNRVTEAGKDNS